MKEEYVLIRFKIFNGEYEYDTYATIKANKYYDSLTDKQIISDFFYKEIDDDYMFNDGTAAKIDSVIPLVDNEVKTLERLSISFVHTLKKQKGKQ